MRRNGSYRVFFSFGIILLWLLSVWFQHETVVRHHEQHTHSWVNPQQVAPAQRNTPSRSSENSPIRDEEVQATFNGIPLSFHPGTVPPPSRIQCTDFDDWRFRSCQYTNLCFDAEQHDFVLMYDNESQRQQLLLQNASSSVSIGGINPRWDVSSPGDTNPSMKGSGKLEWFPRMARANRAGFYQLPDDTVWVPFHSMAAHNVGHMLWDDLYPIYRLLQTWNLLHSKHHQYLLMRHVLPEPLYAACDIRRNKRLGCKTNFETFLRPMFGVDPRTFSTTNTFQFHRSSVEDHHNASSLICASLGVAGIGTLTDHGLADHGWDYSHNLRVPHNVGHARDFWNFGQWALQNALGKTDLFKPTTNALKIIFSLESSKDWDRRLDFAPYRDALQKSLSGTKDVQMEAHRFWELSVEQQLRLTASTSILIATCGGGGVLPVTFLPRGASMVVFYNPEGGYDYASGEKRPDWPARLDWDLLQHAAAHVRVHWFPIRVSGNSLSPVSDDDVHLFVKLIHRELKSVNA